MQPNVLAHNNVNSIQTSEFSFTDALLTSFCRQYTGETRHVFVKQMRMPLSDVTVFGFLRKELVERTPGLLFEERKLL